MNNARSTLSTLSIAAGIVILMLVTRGSHVLTSVSLPDASLALFLLGGLYLQRVRWFVALLALAAMIDFGAAGLNSFYAFCLTPGYWGMIPTYAVMWLGGRWLAGIADAYALLPYAVTGMVTTAVAFIISTQSYYLYSGRFPDEGVIEALRHGWEYLPAYLGYTMMYLAAQWVVVRSLRSAGVIASPMIATRVIAANKSSAH
ncbi:hypothetical protein [Pseudomethylobacillus aquaticus]|uniref:hypothetical protein n=1 Tax=Pseudomethylobacillus aquaticus TaxID=2676064 RepID=UPI00187B6297|nr:hypothetical protein [Pseudomethylobacillus aquaticus]